MELLTGLAHGFAVLFAPPLLLACFAGLLIGMVVGFLPGISPLGGIAVGIVCTPGVMLLAGFDGSIVFMVALAYATLYGRALAAVNCAPADGAGAPARPSRATMAAALAIVILAALATGIFAVYARLNLGLSFGPAEIAALVTFLLLAAAAFGSGSTASALAAAVLGVALGLVGSDIETNVPRFTFGLAGLEDGITLLDMALGLFVVATALHSVGDAMADGRPPVASATGRDDGLVRGVILGLLTGLLPVNGAAATTTVEQARLRRRADPFDPASQPDARGIFGALLASDIRFSLALIPLVIWFPGFDVVTGLLRKV